MRSRVKLAWLIWFVAAGICLVMCWREYWDAGREPVVEVKFHRIERWER